jgi:hypothetical protein
MIVYIVSAVVIVLIFTSCKTKYVTVEKVRTDTTYITKLQRDSIHIHDSIFVNQWQKGDTVYQVRDRWHTEWRDRLLHDTIYKSVVDSVPVPYPVEKEVIKEVTPWYNWLLIGGLLLAVLYLLFKRLLDKD